MGDAGDGPITDMLFDREGRIYLAQRGAQRASYDYSVFAEPEKSDVVRYKKEEPDDPATESVWVSDAEQYAIGMPAEHKHAKAALRWAMRMTRPARCAMALAVSSCGRPATGCVRAPRPRKAPPRAMPMSTVCRATTSRSSVRNVPPQKSYFADYDGFFGDAAKSGHMGDVEIWEPCDGPAPTFGELPPGIETPGDTPPEGEPEDWPDDDFDANLRLTKRAMPHTCLPWVGGWLCRYTIRVTNTGPDNFFGRVVVDDRLPARLVVRSWAFRRRRPGIAG